MVAAGDISISQAERELFEKALRANVVKEITSFMEKPRIAATTTITPAMPTGLLISGNSWTATASDPVFANKVFGFSGIKYTTNIKVVVNSTPFQQGRLRLSIYPNYTAAGPNADLHHVNRMTVSQLPGVDMSINDGSMTLAVPWCSYQEYLDVTGTIVDPLHWRVTIFSPLANGPNATITTANLTVWVWFTDVELFGCSTASIVTQSAKGKSKVKRVAISEQESKPLSSWLSSASTLVSSVSDIPSLAPISGPTSIMLSGLSGLASYFGYSRPVSGEPIHGVATHYHNALPNSQGVSPSSVMALNKDAKVKAITDFSPGGVDEMSINFVKRQWSYFDEFTWSNSSGLGTQLYKRDLNLGYSATVSGSTTLAPITLLSNLFRHYRGGLEIMFKFVKTGFHSGSLAVSCQYGTTSGGNLLLTDTDPLYRTILDIQEGNEFCINFPFMHPADFLQTYELFGTWYMHVVNPLICPETVSQSVVVQMYVRGSEDMEFSTIADDNVVQPVFAQGGVVDEDGEITCEVIGGVGSPDRIKPVVSASTMSETCTSLLQVLKYGSQLFLWSNAAPTQAWYVFDVCPSGAGIITKTGVASAVYPSIMCGFMNVIRACYGFHRGGFEFSVIHTDGLPSTAGSTNNLNPNQKTYWMRSHIAFGSPSPVSQPVDSPGFQYQTGTVKTGTPHTTANACDHGLGGVLPFRNKFRVSPTLLINRTQNLNDTQSLNFMRLSLGVGDTVIMRVSDDYQSLFWLGVPPVVFATI